MKKLYMKQRLFSNLDQFTVKNENEEDCYQIAGDNLQVGGKKLHIRTMDGREAAMVKQKLLALTPQCLVFENGEQVAEIKKKFAFFGSKYVVNGKGWEIKGNVLDHDYSVVDGGKPIVRLHKVWLSWGDSYELEISDGADEVMALAVVLAIDLALEAKAEANS